MEVEINPNWFAYFVLFSWPIVIYVFYQRLSVVRATVWSILGAYLLLPKETIVDMPLVPPLDKVTIPNLAAFLVCRFLLGKPIALLPRLGWARGLMLVYIISPFITALLNADPIVAGPTYIEGMKAYDALSEVIRQSLFVLPFLLGLQFFRQGTDIEQLLSILVIAGLWYSLPMLFEVRMSPQLHTWIYGYFPHSFGQQMRGDGFRPVVFIGHGLWVAFFTMTAVVAAAVFTRLRLPIGKFSSGVVTGYLMVLLLLCKSMASIIYAGMLVTVVFLCKPKTQVRIAILMVSIALTYPLARGLGWFPVQEISELSATISEERAQSFDFRMRNEDMLLDKANLRPWFGWGTWGRNRIYDSKSGRDISVTDGRWIQVIGQFGWAGLLAEFGLLALPVFRCVRALRYVENRRQAIVLSALCLILSINLLDLLPNNTMSPMTWLIAGALLARTESLKFDWQKKEFSRKLVVK